MPARISWTEHRKRWLSRITIDPQTGCWLWPAKPDPRGYVRVTHRSGPRGQAKRLSVSLHRVFYEWIVGEVPEGHELHHSCEVKHCVYPGHLKPLTRLNHLAAHGFIGARKAVERGKQRTHCSNDHPWDDRNTYVAPNGQRFCRACGRDRANRLWAEKRYARQRKSQFA